MYGIEKYYDTFLSSKSGSLSLKYHCDALGRVLNGEPTEVYNDNYNSNSGIVLTIDKDIQKILENALINHNISVGCGIVLDTKTSEILACASLPEIDRSNLEETLKNENSPFINRAFSAYSVGSVFKIVTAASALENTKENLIYKCNGSIIKSDNMFNCNKKDGHGQMDLKSALTYSCNPFFIELACNVGGENLLKTANSLGFNQSTNFGNGYFTDKGNLPKPEELNSDASIGNLGFGQGSLLATPLQIANCYATIANGGYYNQPTLINGFIDEAEIFSDIKKQTSKRVLKTETCDILKEYLLNVVVTGTGKPAFTSLFLSCGKTATAESGQYDKNGAEISHSWYVGFFPYENPQYVICIMKENGISGSSDCAPVFKEVAEGIYILEKLRIES
jgi:penicillin-binding protein 2